MARAVFLDRDGVINRAIVREGKPYPPKDLSELEVLPGVPEALVALKKADFKLIVVIAGTEFIQHQLSIQLLIDAFHDLFLHGTARNIGLVSHHDQFVIGFF